MRGVPPMIEHLNAVGQRVGLFLTRPAFTPEVVENASHRSPAHPESMALPTNITGQVASNPDITTHSTFNNSMSSLAG